MSCCVSLVSDTKNYIELTSFLALMTIGTSYTRIMNSIESSYNAYVHSIDPVLALNFTGEKSNNTYMCHALSSLLFGEIESQALNFTGRSSNSSVSIIFSEILNGANFTLNYTNGILKIQLVGNENYTFIFDLNTGLVYDLTNYENFTYKGAISSESNGNCPYLFIDTLILSIYDSMRYKGDLTYHGQEFKFTNETKHVVSVFLENLFLGSAAILLLDSLPYLSIIPLMPALGIPILVAGGLIAGAFILNYCDNGFNANAALGNTLRDLALNFA